MRCLRYPYDVDEFAALDQLFERRRSTRLFGRKALSQTHFAALLWAAEGLTSQQRRTVPSAHGLHALTLPVVVNNVDDVAPGIYRYVSGHNAIDTVRQGDFGDEIAAISIADADWIGTAAAVLVLSAHLDSGVHESSDLRPTNERFLWMETGHISQNVYLAAAALGIGVTFVGGLDHSKSANARISFVPEGQELLGLVPIGPLPE